MEMNHEAAVLEDADKEIQHLRVKIEQLVADNANLRLSWQLAIKERDELFHQVMQLRVQNGDAY